MRNTPKTIVRRLIPLMAVPILGLLLGGILTSASAQTAADGRRLEPPAAIPAVALIVDGLGPDVVVDLIAELESVAGVTRVTSDGVGGDETVFYLSSSAGLDADGRGGGEGGFERSIDAVVTDARRVIGAAAPDATVLAGGSAVADQALAARYRRVVAVAAVVAALVGLALGAAFGRRRGLLVAVVLPLVVGCGAAIGSQLGGPFDGRLTTTALPGGLTALVAATIVAVRLLVWFRQPLGADGAERIRNSVADLAAEFALAIAGLAVVALIVEFLDPGRSSSTVICAAAAVAVVLTSAVLAPILAVLPAEPTGRARRPSVAVPVSLPDGRDFPLLVLGGVVAALVAISAFALAGPGMGLLDVDRLSPDDEAAVVASKLAVAGGDATTGVLVRKPNDVSVEAFQRWASVVVEQPEIEFVDLTSGRLTSTGPVDVADTTVLVPPTERGRDWAVVVLNISPRSEAGQRSIDLLTEPSLLGRAPVVAGYGADASDRAGSPATVLVAIVALAAVAGLAIQVLTQSRSLAVVAFALRLVAGGATVGVYRLMAPGATVAETMIVLSIMALGGVLIQLEFTAIGRGGYRMAALPGLEQADRRPGDDEVEPNAGQYAAFGLATLGAAGLGMALAGPFLDAPDIGRLSLGLVAVVVIELLSGAMLLTPALLGQRGAFHTAVRPVRVAIHSAVERPDPESTGAGDPTWKRVVEDLVQAEFRLQSIPADADLDTVFVPDTPLYRQAATHHENLARADLRIVGRRPRLRSIKPVSGRSPATLTVTVDHPERHLVARDGTVVGVRKAERRSGVLWLSEAADGSYRIAESVELGSVPLPPADEDADNGSIGVPTDLTGSDSPSSAGREILLTTDDRPGVDPTPGGS
jgi:hypothetical protein